jgi:hypothetical protein
VKLSCYIIETEFLRSLVSRSSSESYMTRLHLHLNPSLAETYRQAGLSRCGRGGGGVAQAATIGFAMSAWGEFAFIVATASREAGTLDSDSYGAVILAVLVSAVYSPLAVKIAIAQVPCRVTLTTPCPLTSTSHARNPFNLNFFDSAQCLMVRRWRLIGYFPILYNPLPSYVPHSAAQAQRSQRWRDASGSALRIRTPENKGTFLPSPRRRSPLTRRPGHALGRWQKSKNDMRDEKRLRQNPDGAPKDADGHVLHKVRNPIQLNTRTSVVIISVAPGIQGPSGSRQRGSWEHILTVFLRLSIKSCTNIFAPNSYGTDVRPLCILQVYYVARIQTRSKWGLMDSLMKCVHDTLQVDVVDFRVHNKGGSSCFELYLRDRELWAPNTHAVVQPYTDQVLPDQLAG